MYSIKKVSEILGIPTVTVRAWENRYGIVNPSRSNGGHRLYSEKDIETLKWLKTQIDEKNMKVSEAVWLLKQKSPVSPDQEEDQGSVISTNPIDFVVKLYGELIDFDSSGAHKTIDLAFALYPYDDVFHRVLVPVLYRIGDDWENGRITVAQEHFSSQLIMERCTQFLRVLPVHDHLPKVLAFCPEGEQHHMGLLLFSLFLRKKGSDVIYLGPNTPLKDLIPLIEMKRVSVVAVSLTDPASIESVERWIRECLKKQPNIKLVLGGTGFEQCSKPLSAYVQPGDQGFWEKWYQETFRHPQQVP